MKSLKQMVVLAVVGVLLSASIGFAGGGSKRNGTVKFVNQTTLTALVTSNANNAAIKSALASMSLTAFTAAGGKELNAGSSATFSVSSGTATVGAAEVNSAGTGLYGPLTENVTVGQGATVTIYIVSTTASPFFKLSSKSGG